MLLRHFKLNVRLIFLIGFIFDQNISSNLSPFTFLLLFFAFSFSLSSFPLEDFFLFTSTVSSSFPSRTSLTSCPSIRDGSTPDPATPVQEISANMSMAKIFMLFFSWVCFIFFHFLFYIIFNDLSEGMTVSRANRSLQSICFSEKN